MKQEGSNGEWSRSDYNPEHVGFWVVPVIWSTPSQIPAWYWKDFVLSLAPLGTAAPCPSLGSSS